MQPGDLQEALLVSRATVTVVDESHRSTGIYRDGCHLVNDTVGEGRLAALLGAVGGLLEGTFRGGGRCDAGKVLGTGAVSNEREWRWEMLPVS